MSASSNVLDFEYVSIGFNKHHLSKEKFQPVKNWQVKPVCALWTSTYYGDEHTGTSDWLEYICDPYRDGETLYGEEHWVDAAIIKFKPETRIFYINSIDDLRPYMSDDYIVDYETISKSYDVAFVSCYNLCNSSNDPVFISLAHKFSVSSQIIFNLDCIEHYHPGLAKVERCYNYLDNCYIERRNEIKHIEPNITRMRTNEKKKSI